MKKHLPNNSLIFKFLFGVLLIGFSISTINAQCINSFSWGSATVSDQSTPPVVINTCVFTSDFSPITVNSPGLYEFSINQPGAYMTFTDASNNVIDHGLAPLTVSIGSNGSYRIHYADNAACAVTNSCFTSTVEYLGPIPSVAVIGTGTLASTNTQNGSPIYRSTATSGFDYAQSVQLLTQADLAAVGITPGATILKIAYKKTTPHTIGSTRTATYRAYIKNSSATALVTTQNFNDWIVGSTLVYENLAMDENDIPIAANSWMELEFSTPFTYLGDGLEIALDWAVNPGTGNQSTGAFNWEYTNTPTNQAVGRSASTQSYTLNLGTGTARLYNCQVTYLPGASCVGVNPPGQTLSNLTSACPSDNIDLSVQNPTALGGIEYQWESSLDGSNWTDIPGADNETFSTSQTVATYYRAKVKCAAASDSAYTSTLFITMAANCPAFAIYNSGNIGSEFNTGASTSVSSACPGLLTVTIPPFAIIDSVSVDYDMEARNGAFMSEQRSYLRCTNPGGTAELNLATASGTAGIATYSRKQLDIANNVIGGGDINFELNAFRTWGGTTCDDFYNYVIDGTFRVLVYYTIPPMCSGQPNAGSISGIPALACSGSNFQLGLSGATPDLGIQYYWQMAPSAAGPWTLVDSGATIDTVLNQNTWVRSYTVCSVSGLSDTTSAAEISLTLPLAGNYTINQNAASSATNFTSFNDFVAALGCGVSGPVVVDVAPNSGPYNERVVFEEIAGVSSTNTITINGNGNLLTHAASVTGERATMMLDGTDYMIIDSLNIEATGNWAWGVQLMNEADHNIIRNCKIEVPTTSTSTFFAGIVMSGSPTGGTTAGNTGSFNTFENNHHIGGYWGYSIMGESTVNRNQGNKVLNCVIEEIALAGIRCQNQEGTEIIGNDVSQLTRTTGTTLYGILFSNSNPAEVSGNRFHDFGTNFNMTAAAYPIYFTAGGGSSVANPVKIFNNTVYNIHSNGIQYGIYLLGTTDNVEIYHNTIVLDNANHTGSSNIATLYHTGAASNVDVKNNIFYIDNGSSGNQYNMWFSNSGSSPTSNNNVFFNTSASGILARRGTTNYSDLAAWQPVLNNDLNSVFLDPTFAGANIGFLMPGDPLAGLGAAGTGVTTDIEGTTRSVTAPTPGAFELKPCDSPPTPGILAATDTFFCAGGDATLSMPDLSVGVGQTYLWQSSPDNSVWSDIVGETDPTLTITDPTLTYYRCIVTCSGVPVNSSSIQVGGLPPLSGVVTINQNTPSTLTNFQSFAELNDALACAGLGGPLTVNVEPNSGPYVEQVEFVEVANASSTNTITINGNGNIVEFDPVSAQRYIFYLNGADHFILDSLTIRSTSTTFGWGVLLNNDASDNIIRNCLIDMSTVTSTVNTNCGGIVMSGSNTSMISASNTGSNNLFENNTITGGEDGGPYYGITMYGSTALQAQNNTALNNTIINTFADAIRFSNMPGVTIDGNLITRPDRSNTTTFYGIYGLGTAGNNTGLVIKNNQIANITENLPVTNTNQMVGIYLTAAGSLTDTTIIYNNVIHISRTNGTHHGIWITQPGIKMYHNTLISESNTSTTGLTRGFYYNGTAANAEGIDFINNIAYVDRTGTSAKHPIHTTQAFTNSTIDYNLYYINAPNSTSSGVGFRGGNRITLAQWQAVDAGAYDQNSSVGDPAFANLANYDPTPLSSDVDNIGTPLPSVTTDIAGNPRSATTPDVGAVEFTGLPGDIAVISAELIQEDFCYGNNDSVAVTIRNLFGSPVDFSVNPLTLVWHVTGPINTSDSAVLNAGVLPAGIDFRLVTDGIDMSLPGTYTLNGYIKPNAVNVSASNDTLVQLVETTVLNLFDVSPQSLTVTSPTPPDILTVTSPLFPSAQVKITEICHFKTANGAPVGGWPAYLLADDYIELTGAPNQDISGFTIEMWTATVLNNIQTFGPGTVLSPQGTAIIATGQLGTSVPSPANYYYHSGNTATLGSTTVQGYIIKDLLGNIVDAVVYGNMSFPAAANVSAADWSGTTPAVSSSGNRLEGPYTKDATNWINSGVSPQDPNIVNNNVSVPTVPPAPGIQWSVNGVNLGTNPEQMVGPFDTSGVYVYRIEYNSVCGVFVDSVMVTADLTKAEVFSFTETTCLTASDAQATVLASGGDAPYTYLWDDPLAQTTSTATNLGVGTYMVIVRDANLHPDTVYVTINNGDVSPPTVITQDITVALDAMGNATITAAQIDNGSFDNCAVAGISVSPEIFTCANLGPNTVTLSVIDDAGNIGTGTAVVTIEDNIAPVVNTQDISVYLDATGNVSITASQIENGSTDNCSVDSMYLDISSFGCADVGANTVTLSVVDQSTNTATGTAIVTVFDTVSPVAQGQDITIYLDANGQATALAADAENGSTDACGIDLNSATLSQTSFDCSNLGNNTVSYSISDINGNTSSTQIIVTVIDTVSPTAVSQDITVYLDANATASITGLDIDGGSTDNCAVVNRTVSQSDFDCDDLGVNVITLVVMDGSGNMDSTTAEVTVVDTNQAFIQTRNPTVYLDSLGNATITFADLDSGSVANCGIDSISVTPDQFSCADIGPNSVNFTIVDISGNTTTGNPTVNIADSTAPVVTVYPPDTVYTSANTCAALVTWKPFIQVFDACSPSFTISSAQPDMLLLGAGTHVLEFSVEDIYGNSRGHSHTFHVIDTFPPVITGVPADVTIPANNNCEAAYSWTQPTASDNCPGVSMTSSHVPGGTFPLGTTTVIYTATDAGGLITTESFNITVLDQTAPTVITQDITLALSAAGSATLSAAAIDNGSFDLCSGIMTMSVSPSSFNCSSVGPNTVVLSVMDSAGNTATGTAVVTVEDVTAPNAVAQNATVYLNAAGIATLSASMIDNGSTDGCGVISSLSVSPSSFSCADVGPNTVTLSVFDPSGNVGTATATVTVLDTISPVVVAANTTVGLDSNGTVSVSTAQMAGSITDNCGIDVITVTPNTFTCANMGPNTVSITAMDMSGNTTTATGTVTIVDNIAPVALAQDQTVFLDANGQATLLAADVNNGSTDNCSSTLSFSLSKSNFDCGDLGNQTVTFFATDADNNVGSTTFNVTVLDTIAPVASSMPPGTIFVDNSGCNVLFDWMSSISTSDACSQVTINSTMANPLLLGVGTHVINFTLTDVSNNSRNYSHTIIVQDTISPTLSGMPANISVDAGSTGCGANVNWGTPTASDNCSGVNLTTTHGPGSFFPLGTTTVTYTATDASNNSVSGSFDVTVTDNTGPVINGQPATVYLDATGSASVTVADVTTAAGITDNCGVQTSSLSQSSFGCANIGTNNVTITATDVNNNTSTLSVVVTVLDTIAPVLTNVPANITVSNDAGLCGAVVNWPTITATDNCPSPLVTATPPSGSFFAVGTHVVNVVVTDASNNQSTASFTVTVEDTEAPNVTFVPADEVLGHCQAVFNYNPPMATDNCGPVTVTQIAGLASGSTFPTGTTTNTFEITDIHNNSVTVSFDVTITPQYNDYTATNFTVCRNDNPFDLTNGVANVSFAGSGLLPDGITFSPALSGTGNHQIIASFTDSMGCVVTSTFFVLVNPNPDVPIINQVSSTQLRVQQQFTTYQWFRNGVPIAGATQQVLNITQTGVYQVEVGNAQGCKTMSEQFGVGVNVSVHDFDKEITNIKLFPNPSRGKITLEFPNPNGETHLVRIIDMAGRVVYVRPVDKEVEEFDLSHLAQGAYMLQLSNGTQNSIKPFIIGQ
jgi:hypothetical protein